MMSINDLILGRYQVEEPLSDGGQASVARGLDLQTGQRVAIRQLLPARDRAADQREIQRFNRAGSLRIQSPYVVNPLACAQDGPHHYMILPYIDGDDLEVHLLRGGGFYALDKLETLVRDLASGLSACRAAGVVHRDIKPANIMLDRSGRAHLIDFGICRCLSEATLSDARGFTGSVQWTAPEQITDPDLVDHRADLYALGAVLYQCMTSRMPVQGTTAQEVMLSVCTWDPPAPRSLNSRVPAHLDRLCMRLLAKAPQDRPQTADDVLRALDSHGSPGASAFCSSCGRVVSGRFCSSCGASHAAAAVVAVRCLACGTATSTHTTCLGCARTFGPVEHRITFLSGALAGATFRLPQGEYEVGRATLEPRDAHLSRRHFHIRCHNGAVELTDLGSANTIRVGGVPATQKTRLVEQAELRLAGNVGIYTCN